MIGKLHKPHTLLLRLAVGEATHDSGQKYELSTSAGGSQPIVRSESTGRWFILAWQDIINLARKAGIDEPTTVAERAFPVPKAKKAVRS